jgi:hypothetical protein
MNGLMTIPKNWAIYTSIPKSWPWHILCETDPVCPYMPLDAGCWQPSRARTEGPVSYASRGVEPPRFPESNQKPAGTLSINRHFSIKRGGWELATMSCLDYRRKFRSQTSDDIMDRWKKQRWKESGKRKKRKNQQTKGTGARKVAKQCVFPMLCSSGGSKK